MNANQRIRERMEVVGADGHHVGTVDHVDHLEGEDRIKLTRDDSFDGKHHYIPTRWVDHVDNTVHLNRPADEAIGAFE
jgi:hypothetical protein